MTKIDLIDFLVRNASEYRKDPKSSLDRNRHTHNAGEAEIHRTSYVFIDAVLTDFVNFVAMKQGIDLALYSKDLAETGK